MYLCKVNILCLQFINLSKKVLQFKFKHLYLPSNCMIYWLRRTVAMVTLNDKLPEGFFSISPLSRDFICSDNFVVYNN